MWISGDFDGWHVGEVGFLVERFHENTGRTTYEIRSAPARKNLSGEEVLRGWCGSTNNVSRTADGIVRIARITSEECRAQVVGVRATAEALNPLGWPELADGKI